MEPARTRARGRLHVECLLCLALALSLLAIAETALAEGNARIVLVAAGEHTLARRLHAEAEAAGLSVVESGDGAAGTDPAELQTRFGAAAVIRVASADRAEIHVGVSDGAISRTLTRRAADGDSFALRVVEEVYARLVELHLVEPRAAPTAHQPSGPSAPVAEAPVSPSDDRAPDPVRPPDRAAQLDRAPAQASSTAAGRLWLSGGLAGTQPSGGIGGTLHAALGVRLEPAPRLALGAHALLPLTENSLSGPEGSADANANMFLASLDYSLLELARDVTLNAGIGAGLLVLSMEGEAAPPFTASSDRTTTGVYFAQSGLAWTVASWLRLRGTVMGGLTAPRPVVRFDDREVAAWGRFFAGAAVASEFGLALSGPGAPP